MTRKIILGVIFSLFVACSTTEIEKIQKNDVSVKNEQKVEENMNKEITLKKYMLEGNEFVSALNNGTSIGFSNGRVYGSTGINRYFASYDVVDGKLVFTAEFGMTRASGSQKERIVEYKFITALKENEKMTLRDDKLILIDKFGSELEFIHIER